MAGYSFDLIQVLFICIAIPGFLLQIISADMIYELRTKHPTIYEEYLKGTKETLFDKPYAHGFTNRKIQICKYIFTNKCDIKNLMPLRQKMYTILASCAFISLATLLLLFCVFILKHYCC